MTGATGTLNLLKRADDALGVLEALSEERIKKLTLFEVDPKPAGRSPGLGKSPEIQEFVPQALELRENFNIPYWMSIFFVATNSGKEIPEKVLDSATFHVETSTQKKVEIATSSDLVKEIDATIALLPADYSLMVSSKVLTVEDEYKHVPMLDFRLKSTHSNHSVVSNVVRRLGLPGVVLDSGRSYHFYGASLITDTELTQFLAKALLFTPLVDYRWIAHQLLEGACALRVSPGGAEQITPRVIEIVA
ncbi:MULTISPECIES: hypothetical protein [unclassified Amycolatopsis]|uniref:primase 1D-like protein n=1 Tax=unclassified Amycolatopsis TaxID=2618356 RepID=UPI002874BD68|nr:MULTISPECIES: hypothetical protein [unclassified Amycolatopsis]MDS0133607.1 hypothetical protein [Amycolatopsis sp. 505]MDS0148548.1 hypothetical protein [Amycolatopsis sp. CM201R]